MPDPHKDLADIIEPALVAAPAPPDIVLPIALTVSVVLLIAGVYWRWRRGAPLRQLRRLARNPDIPAAAAELAHMRLFPSNEVWQQDLDCLRFAPPRTDDAATDVATLARLCREAEAFLK